MFFPKSDLNKQKTLLGMHHTEVRSWDAPKPPFSIKTAKSGKIRKSGFDQPSLFLSLFKWLSLWICICFQNDPNLLSTPGIINKTCILDPIQFWWVP